MKKAIILVSFVFLSVGSFAQIKLADQDLKNLISLSLIYSGNNMYTGPKFAKSADSLRTPLLNHVVDVLLATGKQDTSILQKKYLRRPAHDELMLWYTIRGLHYNRIDTAQKPRPDMQVAKEILASTVDERWLLDNYYYMIHSGIATLFNTADLHNYDLNLDELELKDDTEKGIFFLNMMDALINGRLLVLRYMKNNDRIMMFCNNMPTFNGKPYYNYTNLSFPDFDWIGYKKVESYKARHVGSLMNTLVIQFTSTASIGNKDAARALYLSSILHNPDYFKYSSIKDELQKLYDQGK